MKRNLIFVITCVLFFNGLQAQYFVEESLSFSKKKDAYVITTSGEKIEGRFAWLKFNRYSIKELALEIDGKKKSFKPDEIVEFVGVPSNFTKFNDAMDRGSNINKLTDADFEQVLKKDSSYFERAMIPRKKEYRMVQLLNPGFDSKIKVFKDPFGKETASVGFGGMTVAGGEEKSLLVKKAGVEETMYVKKKTYPEQFVELFGDCQELMDTYKDQPNSIKIKYFAEHVFLYDQLCK